MLVVPMFAHSLPAFDLRVFVEQSGYRHYDTERYRCA